MTDKRTELCRMLGQEAFSDAMSRLVATGDDLSGEDLIWAFIGYVERSQDLVISQRGMKAGKDFNERMINTLQSINFPKAN